MPKRQRIPDSQSSITAQPRTKRRRRKPRRQPAGHDGSETNAEEQNTDRQNLSLQNKVGSSAHPRALPALDENIFTKCFRISNISLEWDKQRTLEALAVTDADHDIDLFPSTNGEYLVGILTLSGSQTYVNGFAPSGHDNSKRLVLGKDYQLTIDRHFYGLTPLNKAADEVVVE